jgi:hypothetical protein
MPTPSIQTLVTDAQQILNLDSISAVRSVVAVALANANTGTPLNPNLTTQQLWNEFYQVVNKPKSDIESIIANQLMKFLFAPPAPGGVGANGQVIFNDGGVLAGDPQFLWNKTTNLLTVTGAATITGDLTVDTNVLKVDTLNNRVGVLTASPSYALDVRGAVNGTHANFSGNSGRGLLISTRSDGVSNDRTVVLDAPFTGGGIAFQTQSTDKLLLDSSGNLGLGVTPQAWDGNFKAMELGYPNFIAGNAGAYRIDVGVNGYFSGAGYKYAATGVAASYYSQSSGAHRWYNAASGTAGNAITFTQAMTLDASGNLLVGTTAQTGRLDIATANGVDCKFGMLVTGTQRWQFIVNNSTAAFSIYDQTNSGTRLLIDTSGNVGVGVTPLERLTIAGSGSFGGTGNIGVKFHSATPASNNLSWLLANDSANSNVLNLYYYSAGVFSGRAFVVNQSGNFMVRTPSTPPTIPDNEMMVFNLTSNTNLRISVKGTDGTTRTANITLA